MNVCPSGSAAPAGGPVFDADQLKNATEQLANMDPEALRAQVRIYEYIYIYIPSGAQTFQKGPASRQIYRYI